MGKIILVVFASLLNSFTLYLGRHIDIKEREKKLK